MASKLGFTRIAVSSVLALTAGLFVNQPVSYASTSTTYNVANAGTWTVPAGVTSIQVTAYGGGGGVGGTDGAGNVARQPGDRGLVTRTFSVNKGDVIGIYPGRKGGNGTTATGTGGGSAGTSTYSSSFNGGTGGNAGSTGSSGGGGGGGAATILRINNSTVLVAGGSGGGGGAANISGAGRDGFNTHLANGTSTSGANGIQTTNLTCGKVDGGGSGAGGGGQFGGQSGGLQAEGSECWGFGGYPGNNFVSGGSGTTPSFTSTGKTSDGQIIIAYTVETTPPVSSGTVAQDYLTSGNTISVSFTASDASGIQSVTAYYSINSNLSSPASCGTYTGANTSGTITCTLPSVDRTYYLYTRAVDQAGNIEAAPLTADAIIIRDTTKPTSAVSIDDDYFNSGTTVTLNYTASDATSGLARVRFWYSTNSNLSGATVCNTLLGSDIASSGTINCTVPATDATYYFYSIADDNAGLTQDTPVSANDSIIRDTVAPAAAASFAMQAASDTGQSSTDLVTKNTTLTFDLSFSESNLKVELFANGSSISSVCNFATTSGTCSTDSLTEGTYVISAKATDAAGNISLASSEITVTIDATAPTVTINQNIANPYSERTTIFTFVFNEPVFNFDPTDSNNVTIAGSGYSISGSTGSAGDTTFTLTLNNPAPVDSDTVSATVISSSLEDLAGNSGPASNQQAQRAINIPTIKNKWIRFIWGELIEKF